MKAKIFFTILIIIFTGIINTPELHAQSAEQEAPALLVKRAPDPWITYYNGFYYFAATTGGRPSKGLTMRKSETLNGLADANEKVVWKDGSPQRDSNYWAPEFFLLDGPNGRRWYGYFTGGKNSGNYRFTQYLHVIESEGADPMGPYSYKGKLIDRTGLDATILQLNGKLYAVYSVWNIFQEIAIKEMETPWQTRGFESVISRPFYLWEFYGGPVNEAPALLYHDDDIFIIYSASSCGGPGYKLGILKYKGGDPLMFYSWEKSEEPFYKTDEPNNIYGPGHCCFFKDPEGQDWICFHANDSADGGCDSGRNAWAKRIFWDPDGMPLIEE